MLLLYLIAQTEAREVGGVRRDTRELMVECCDSMACSGEKYDTVDIVRTSYGHRTDPCEEEVEFAVEHAITEAQLSTAIKSYVLLHTSWVAEYNASLQIDRKSVV